MKRKTALVFGCYGQDGSLISRSLLEKDFQVIGTSRKGKSESNKLNNLFNLNIDNKVHIEKGDITEIKFIEYIIKKYEPDEIYNLAAQSSVSKSFYNPIITIESIVNGTINILETSKRLQYKGRIFFAGSSEIFGNTITQAGIDHHQKPGSPYAIAKQTSFKLVELFREVHKIKCLTGVLFNHESTLREEIFVTQKIISGAIESSQNKSHKIELGNIDIARDWGWAEEYVEAMQIIARSKDIKDHVICTGKLTTLKEFINLAYSKFNLNWQDHVIINKSLKRKNDILQSFGNPIPLEKELQWKAKLSLEEIIINMIEAQMKRKSNINHLIEYF